MQFLPWGVFAIYLEKILRFIAPGRCGSRCGWSILFSCFILGTTFTSVAGICQTPGVRPPAPPANAAQAARPEKTTNTPAQTPSAGRDPVAQWEGLTVRSISF